MTNTQNPGPMYAITATVETDGGDGYTGMRQIPTFYLNANVQGILNEKHAQAVAYDILTAAGTNRAPFHITAVKL